MELKEYQELAKRTNADLGSPLLNNIHMVMGMETEVGELMDVFKKNLAYKKEIDWVNVKEELADVMWYIVNFCEINNINLNECLAANIAKLQKRYPKNFNIIDATNRDLNAERQILENEL